MPNPTLVGLARILNARGGWFHDGFEDRGSVGPHEQCQLYVEPAFDPPRYAVKSPDGSEWLSWDRDAAGDLYLSWRKDEPGQPGPWEMWLRDPSIPERLVSVEFPDKDFYVAGDWPSVAPPVPERGPAPDIDTAGPTWTSYDAFWCPCGISMLSPLADICTEDEWRAFFELHAAAGFTAVRTFCGALLWSDRPQSAARARERMPAFFDMAAEYGMAVWAVLITDSKDGGYDIEEHLRLCAPLTNRPHVVPVLCNEVGHSTQNNAVATFENLRRWGAQYFGGQPWSVGAPVDGVTAPPDAKPRPGQHFDRDEPTPVDWQDMDGPQEFRGHGGPSMDAHLDRERPFWDNARRDREIYACSEVEETVCINAEPKRDETDPTWYAILGALDRCFSGGGFHHCQHGLDITLPDPAATDRMRAYVLAHQLCDAALNRQRGGYFNSGHQNSPVGIYSQEIFDTQLCRHYAFTNGNVGVSPVIGVDPNLKLSWANGWQPVELLKAWTAAHDGKQLQLWKIAYGARGRKRRTLD